jgi:hypothetical protein
MNRATRASPSTENASSLLGMHRCAEGITRGLGLAWFYDRVVLALPSADFSKNAATLKGTMTKTEEKSSKSPQLDVVDVVVDPFGEQENEAIGSLA